MVMSLLVYHTSSRTRLLLRLLRHGELLMASVRLHTTRTRGKNPTTTYHHTLTLLTDSGRAEDHVISAGRRMDELLDERLEPVLANLTPRGRGTELWPLDDLLLVTVSDRGRWRLSWAAWSMFGITVLGWTLYLLP
jgi:hypothetical protein